MKYALRNALQWLALCDGSYGAKLDKFAEALTLDTVGSASVFQWENLLLRLIKALDAKNTSEVNDIKDIASSPAHENSQDPVLFRQIVTTLIDHSAGQSSLEKLLVQAPWLQGFMGMWLRVLANPSPRKNATDPKNSGIECTIESPSTTSSRTATQAVDTAKIRIDLRYYVLDIYSQKESTDPDSSDLTKRIASRHLSKAFNLLHEKGKISRPNFLFEIFGISNYSPEIHDSKILNLLARMRSLAGSRIRFGVKEGIVFAIGDWSYFEFIGSTAHFKKMGEANTDELHRRLDCAALPKLAVGDESWKTIVAYSMEEGLKVLSRRELEFILGTPRSTTNRLIESLVRKSRLQPEGSGPKRTYRIMQSDKTNVPLQSAEDLNFSHVPPKTREFSK